VDAIYDYYAKDLYDYCLTFVDPETAADALHDALLVAIAWSHRLESRNKYALWLYALTRNECLRVLRRGGGAPPPAAGAHSVDSSPRRLYSVDDENAQGVLREVYDLVHRHAFDVREVATVLGISPSRAQTLCERSEEQLGGRRTVITPANARSRAPLPPELRSRVLSSANVPSRVTYRGELAAPRLRSGFPVPLDRIEAYKRGRTYKAAGAAAALILVVGGAFLAPTTSRHNMVGLLGSSRPVSGDVRSPVDSLPPSDPSTAGPSAGKTTPSASAPAPGWSPLPSSGSGQRRAVAGAVSGVGGKCAEVKDIGGATGSAIQLFGCSSAPNQKWTVSNDGTLRALGKCMTVRNNGKTDGTEVQLQPCNGSAGQQWKHQENGSLLNPAAKRCLEAPTLNASDTTQLVIWECSGADNQSWDLPN
jgi:DNA-directed RNA polymerase specialized sigma24 family protein